MKLIGSGRASNPRRVRMFIAEKGITGVENVELNIKRGDNLSPEFLAMNPSGKVPVLELDDGSILSESVAICRYLESRQPEPNLMGRDGREIAEIEMWLRRVDFDMQQSASMAFRHIKAPFADREEIVPRWGEINREKLEEFVDFLDRHLSSKEFIAADRFTLVDINALCALEQGVNLLGLEVDGRRPYLTDWYESIKKRDCYGA